MGRGGRRRVVRRGGGIPITRSRTRNMRKDKMKEFYRSPRLTEQPERVVVLDEHDFAGVGSKLAKALKDRYDTVQYLPLRRGGVDKHRFRDAFGPGPNYSRTLLLIIEPGSGVHQPDAEFHRWLYHTYKGATRPNVPFGIYWCGSLCRVTNMELQYKLPLDHARWLRQRRDYLDSLTPLRMCATECLESLGTGLTHKFVGQPYPFPAEMPKKPAKHHIMHTPTAPFKTDCFKGTNKIKQAFESVKFDKKCRATTEIVHYGTPNTTILNRLDRATMYALTMTDWDSGMGYGGIEALARGCLVFTKKPTNTTMKTPIIHVNDPTALYKKIKYYSQKCNRAEYESLRREQFEWARAMFSPDRVANRVYKHIQKLIDTGWS